MKTKAGTRAFSVAAPTLWNSLPASVKLEGNTVSFRCRLKTYLFKAAYLLWFIAHSSTHWRLTHCYTVTTSLIPWFCWATELDLRRYWRIRSHHHYYYVYSQSSQWYCGIHNIEIVLLCNQSNIVRKQHVISPIISMLVHVFSESIQTGMIDLGLAAGWVISFLQQVTCYESVVIKLSSMCAFTWRNKC